MCGTASGSGVREDQDSIMVILSHYIHTEVVQ